MNKITIQINKIESLKKEKKYQEAINLINSLIAKHEDYRLYEELADIYLYFCDYEKAMSSINHALEIHSKSATGMYLKGFLLLIMQDYSKALDNLLQSNKLLPNNAEVLRNIGWAYGMLGETSKGIIFLKRALNISPDNELVLEDLGMALLAAGEIQEGTKMLIKIGKEGKIEEILSKIKEKSDDEK